MMRRASTLHLYVWAVSTAGAALLLTLVVRSGVQPFVDRPLTSLALVALLVLGEIRPVRIERGSGNGIELSMSTPFALALLVTSGTAVAAVALAAATVLADALHRKPLIRICFNAAQYTLSLAGFSAVVHLWTDGGYFMTSPVFTASDVALVLVAGCIFFALNSTLPAVAVALDQGLRPMMVIRRDLGYQLASAGVSTALAPVIVVVSQHSVLLLPVFMLPAVAVHWSAEMSLRNERLSLHDALTGLPNRSLFHFRVENALSDEEPSAVMLVDLDHFKEVNDTLGHDAGDQLLVQAGRRLQEALGPEATVARLGGDEFALLLPRTNDHAAMVTAQRVCGALSEPFVVDDFVLPVEGSIGVAMHPTDGHDSGTLLRCADVAMYLAKETRSGWQRYSLERDGNSKQRLGLVGEIGTAIDTGQFVLFYQPQLDLHTGRIVGVEALVRWQHPVLGLLQPARFLSLIEKTVHMKRFTEHVVDEALAQCSAWQARGLELFVAVNVAASILHSDTFAGDVAELLAAHGVPPSRLELEVTESTIMADRARGMTTLRRLNAMGTRLAIDDFGTGYSSLSHLKQLPIHTIKIDKSFVMDMSRDADDEKIVQSIIGLGRNLCLDIVAEGVSDASTLEKLRSLGCNYAQGFHIGRPMPATQLESLMTSFTDGPARGAGASSPTAAFTTGAAR